MKRILLILLTILFCNSALAQKEEEKKENDYIEFDDRKNVIHGVYLGFGAHYGKMDSEDTYLATLKLAYVANKKLELGVAFTGFYNDRPNIQPELFDGKDVVLFGVYGGFHFEPILFGDRFVSISFPTLIGGGLVSYRGIDTLDNDVELSEDDFDDFFIVETGFNILYNFSRYTQLETGFRYRLTSDYDLSPLKSKNNLNGYSIVIGLKIGVFNLKRQKKIKDKF